MKQDLQDCGDEVLQFLVYEVKFLRKYIRELSKDLQIVKGDVTRSLLLISIRRIKNLVSNLHRAIHSRDHKQIRDALGSNSLDIIYGKGGI